LAPVGAGSESDGDLDVTAPTTLVGEGPSATMIDGGGISRVFHTDAPGVAMRNLGIQNGSDLTIGTNTGGGIDNDGELTLENVAVLSNTGVEAGGIAHPNRTPGIHPRGIASNPRPRLRGRPPTPAPPP